MHLVRVGTDCGNRAGLDDREEIAEDWLFQGTVAAILSAALKCLCMSAHVHPCLQHSVVPLQLQTYLFAASVHFCVHRRCVHRQCFACTSLVEWIAATVQAYRVVAFLQDDLEDDEGTVAAIFPCILFASLACSQPPIHSARISSLCGWFGCDVNSVLLLAKHIVWMCYEYPVVLNWVCKSWNMYFANSPLHFCKSLGRAMASVCCECSFLMSWVGRTMMHIFKHMSWQSFHILNMLLGNFRILEYVVARFSAFFWVRTWCVWKLTWHY